MHLNKKFSNVISFSEKNSMPNMQAWEEKGS